MSFNSSKLEQVCNKIKLITAPNGIREYPKIDQNTGDYYDANTNERAIVRLTIPQKQVEVEEDYIDPETGNEVKRFVMKTIEVE